MTVSRFHLLAFGSAAGIFGVPLVSRFALAAAAADPSDLASLNAAVEIERAGIKAYTDALATGLLTPPVRVLAQRFIADHTAHRDALIGAVRTAGAQPSEATFALTTPSLGSERDILAFANVVEMKAAATYLSVVPDLKNRELAGVAASILGVETMHVALLAEALGTRVYASGFVG